MDLVACFGYWDRHALLALHCLGTLKRPKRRCELHLRWQSFGLDNMLQMYYQI